MSRKKIILLIGSTLVVAGLALLFWRQWQRPVSWQEHYDKDSRDPYGTYVAFQLLKGSYPGDQTKVLTDSIAGVLPSKKNQDATYVFIGEKMHIPQDGIDTLLQFVAAGNNVFISVRNLPYYLAREIFADGCENEGFYQWEGFSFHQDTVVRLNLKHPALRLAKPVPYRLRYYKRYVKESWAFFPPQYFCETQFAMIPLGHMNGSMVNFVRIPYGDGYFYLHSTPLAFTNYHLLRPEALRYADGVFSHFGKGPLYWDERSKFPVSNAMEMPPPMKGLSSKSPLQYILSQAPLAWAWYLLLFMGLAYLLLRSRRRQRIVPVLEPNTNTSLEFVSTIGRLHFLQNNHRQLCLQKMRLFQQFLRERYGLYTLDADEAFLAKLAAKSEVSRNIIDKIFLLHTNIQSSSWATENTLAQFHGLIEEFYRTCK